MAPLARSGSWVKRQWSARSGHATPLTKALDFARLAYHKPDRYPRCGARGQHCRNPHKREDGEGAHADRGVQMAPEAVTAASKTIAHEFGEEYLPENPRFYSAKAKNAQGA